MNTTIELHTGRRIKLEYRPLDVLMTIHPREGDTDPHAPWITLRTTPAEARSIAAALVSTADEVDRSRPS